VRPKLRAGEGNGDGGDDGNTRGDDTKK